MRHIVTKLLPVFIFSCLISGCIENKPDKFGSEAPVKKLLSAFPSDLIYQTSPDDKVIIGKKPLARAVFEISGFDAASGKPLWRLPNKGEVVEKTEKQILVYEETSNSVYFINPIDGRITRTISPAPNPLSSKNSLERGMAFTDEFYITIRPLYGKVIDNNKLDDSFAIGITAKSWESKDVKWYVPPVKQIVVIEYRPFIFGDKVLIINPMQSLDGGHSYQIISLTTGEELLRKTTDGEYYAFDNGIFIEKTNGFIRRFDPFSDKVVWNVEGDFKNARVSIPGGQVSIATPTGNRERVVRLINVDTGKELKTFTLPYLQGTTLDGGYLASDGLVWLHFANELYKDAQLREYDYMVGYDADTKKALWRTDFKDYSDGSLLSVAADKLKADQ